MPCAWTRSVTCLWGYDWHKDYDGSPMEEYFLSVAREDFRLRRCVNFAVRLGGDFIGEAVLYNPDWQGGMELGCRIAPAYAGCGYGTEAFAAAADWPCTAWVSPGGCQVLQGKWALL